MWRLVIAIVFIMHGVGHVMGVFSVFGLFTGQGLSSRSWLLTGILGDSAASWFSLLLWTAALLGFVGAGFGLLGWLVPEPWWQPLAIGAAVISLLGLLLYWHAFFTLMNKMGAIGVDLAVLVALLWLHWPVEALANPSP